MFTPVNGKPVEFGIIGNRNSLSENIKKPRKVGFWGKDYELKQYKLEMIITKTLNKDENFIKIKNFWNRKFDTNYMSENLNRENCEKHLDLILQIIQCNNMEISQPLFFRNC